MSDENNDNRISGGELQILMVSKLKTRNLRGAITDQRGHFADPILHCGQCDLAGPK